MDGLIARLPGHISQRPVRRRGVMSALWSARWLGLFVFLPTLLTGIYMFCFAADQYESEARFVVRGQGSQTAGGGLGQFLGITTGLNTAQAEAYSISDFLESHDAVAALQTRLNLVDIYRRPEADILFRLMWSHPSAETLLRYYRYQVTITHSQDTGITRLRVLAFRPEDAHAIAEMLLELGEQRVNEFNKRAITDTLRVSQDEVFAAEDRVTKAQKALTEFRLKQQDINPEKTSTAQLSLVATLQGQLAQARAQQIAMGAAIRSDSPQAVALGNRIRALESQVFTEASKLTGASSAMAPSLADYEGLALRREFASTNYNAAQAAYENAKLQALRQQLFVVRVVEPNMPQLALYPRSYVIVSTVLASLLLAYGIGWLILVGIKEHGA